MCKRILVCLLLAAMLCGVLAACNNNKLISAEEAKSIALKDMGITEE